MEAEAIFRRAEAVDEQILRVLVDEFFKYLGAKVQQRDTAKIFDSRTFAFGKSDGFCVFPTSWEHSRESGKIVDVA